MPRDRPARRASVGVVGAIVAATALASCAAISGLGGLTFDGVAGAGGTSSGSRSTTTAASAGGSGGAMAGEDCSNGKDDDGNGLVDCKDPACDAFACDATPPSGWSGPIAFYDGADEGVVCPPAFPVRALEGGTAATAIQPQLTCSPCGCDTAACGSLDLIRYGDAACLSQSGSGSIEPSTCVPAPVASGLRVTRPTANGSCNASGGQVVTRPPPTYVDHAIGCAPKSLGKGCGGGDVCAPKPANPFGAELCVYQPGQSQCPAGYTKPTVVMTALVDTRTCNGCSCGSPTHRCNVDVRFHADANCTDDMGGVSDVCFSPNGVAYLEVLEVSPCNAFGGGQGGNVVAGQPVTVCCR